MALTPYSTLAQVKANLLEIASGDNSFDTELQDLQTNVNLELNRIVKRYTSLPVQNANVTAELAYIEAEWVASEFRKRRPQPIANQPASDKIKDMKANAEARVKELLGSEYWGNTRYVNTQRYIAGGDYPQGWFLQS